MNSTRKAIISLFVFILTLNFSYASAEVEYDNFDLKTYDFGAPTIDDLSGVNKNNLPSKTDILAMIDLQTIPKSQGKRGTCTMFSSIGILEHLMIKKGYFGKDEIDLSEEYMEYIIMKDKTTEGSSTSKNMKAILESGFVFEETWPYIGLKWLTLDDHPLARPRCGHFDLPGLEDFLASCLWGHRDPTLYDMSVADLLVKDKDFFVIRNEANKNRDKYQGRLFKYRNSYKLKYTSSVKKLLSKGQSVIMGLKLYYGSWNSSKTTTLEIQERDKEKFFQGIVTYPEVGTRDRRISGEKGGGHSVVLVGYDDDKVVTSRMQMEDGSWKEFTYKGVYYFKNSWGVKGFGKNNDIEGKNLPGYGMITQKYAHEFGRFFQVN